jgi:hypothetical protein
MANSKNKTTEIANGWKAYQINKHGDESGIVKSGIGVIVETPSGVCFIPDTKIIEIREEGTEKFIRHEIMSAYTTNIKTSRLELIKDIIYEKSDTPTPVAIIEPLEMKATKAEPSKVAEPIKGETAIKINGTK